MHTHTRRESGRARGRYERSMAQLTVMVAFSVLCSVGLLLFCLSLSGLSYVHTFSSVTVAAGAAVAAAAATAAVTVAAVHILLNFFFCFLAVFPYIYYILLLFSQLTVCTTFGHSVYSRHSSCSYAFFSRCTTEQKENNKIKKEKEIVYTRFSFENCSHTWQWFVDMFI